MKLKDADNPTPILRLRAFVKWAQKQGLCSGEPDFERQCGLSAKYIANNASNGKGNIGSEMLGRVVKTFPQLNLVWICTGEGSMVLTEKSVNLDYRQAYEGAIQIVDALNKIIRKTK